MNVLTKFRMDIFFCYTAPPDKPISGKIVPKGMEIIELVTDGEVLFKVDGTVKNFGRGSVFWSEAGERTVHVSAPGKTYSCIAFQFLARHRRLVSRIGRWSDLSTLEPFIQTVFRARQQENCDLNVLEECFRGMILWNAYMLSPTGRQGGHPPALTRIMDCIDVNVGHELTLAELARKSSVSVPYLHVLFRKHVGKTPHFYIRERRLGKAAVLLGKSNMPIKEISLSCGFKHLEVFYRIFKRKYGMTPLQYRNSRPDTALNFL